MIHTIDIVFINNYYVCINITINFVVMKFVLNVLLRELAISKMHGHAGVFFKLQTLIVKL